jgi:Glyoxalase-like domain
MLIDHLVYAAPDLPAAVAEVEARFGVRARAGGAHTGSGTRNALLALGPRTYLEIIAPDPGQPAPPAPRPFGVDGLRRGGLAGWALACDDIDAAVARARSRGYDPGEVAGGQHRTRLVMQHRLAAGNICSCGMRPVLPNWVCFHTRMPIGTLISLGPCLFARGAASLRRRCENPARKHMTPRSQG